MNIIRLSELNKHCHSNNPVSTRSLIYRAENGNLPGAFQYHKGGRWHVDLDAYTRGIQDLIDTQRSDSVDKLPANEESAVIDSIYEEFTRAGQTVS